MKTNRIRQTAITTCSFLMLAVTQATAQISGPTEVAPGSKHYYYEGDEGCADGNITWNVTNGEVVYEGYDYVQIKWGQEGPAGTISNNCGNHVYEVSIKGPVINFSYDASGNRTSRYLIQTGLKGSKEGLQNRGPEGFSLEKGKVLLYPNPTSGLLNFEIKSTEDEGLDIKVKVYTISGGLIVEEKHSTARFEVDITGQANGTYLLDLYVNNKKQGFTIIKK